MMKTLCIAAVVLSLTSVCQPASLDCDNLLKPVDKSPDLSGRWFIIAMSSEICMIPALLNSLMFPSIAVDITAQAKPNIYETTVRFKLYDHCAAESETVLFERNIMFEVDSNHSLAGSADVLLQTGCPDCLVLKGNDTFEVLLLLSRRQNVTDAELKEFRMQVKCLDWAEAEILNTDHDYKNCKSLDDDSDVDFSALWSMMSERLKNSFKTPLKCITKDISGFINAIYEIIQEE
ncbi:uncharacterized protein [Channa argus]|uniref:uncharacterized protein n=1 Tax=Channa argus TaxID=215402 RepID=UPI0035208109